MTFTLFKLEEISEVLKCSQLVQLVPFLLLSDLNALFFDVLSE